MSGHTPGPWLAADAISSCVGLPVVKSGEGGGRLICNVNHAHDPMHGKVAGDDAFNREALSNARLIAAAPDMLDALEQALLHIEVDESTHGRPFAAGNVIRAAIARAEGRP